MQATLKLSIPKQRSNDLGRKKRVTRGWLPGTRHRIAIALSCAKRATPKTGSSPRRRRAPNSRARRRCRLSESIRRDSVDAQYPGPSRKALPRRARTPHEVLDSETTCSPASADLNLGQAHQAQPLDRFLLQELASPRSTRKLALAPAQTKMRAARNNDENACRHSIFGSRHRSTEAWPDEV